jgi:mevalonate kinase
LFILPVWTGVSASTTELLGRVAEFRDNNPGDYSRLMLQLFDHAQQADQAWQSGEAAQALAALSAYGVALQTFDYDAAIGIYTEPHNRIRDIVEREGASYKVSGAGGGDFGLAMTTSANVHEALQAALIEQNLFVLQQPFAAPGLIVES